MNLLNEFWYITKRTSNPIKIFITNHERFRQQTRGIKDSSIQSTLEKGMKQLEKYAIKPQRKVFVIHDVISGLNIVGRFKGKNSFALITVIKKYNFITQPEQTLIKV